MLSLTQARARLCSWSSLQAEELLLRSLPSQPTPVCQWHLREVVVLVWKAEMSNRRVPWEESLHRDPSSTTSTLPLLGSLRVKSPS